MVSVNYNGSKITLIEKYFCNSCGMQLKPPFIEVEDLDTREIKHIHRYCLAKYFNFAPGLTSIFEFRG